MIKTITSPQVAWLVALLACWISPVTTAETIRYGVIAPPNHMWSQVMQQFKTNLERASGQQIVIKESRFAKVRGEAHIVDSLKKGQLQVGIVAAGGLTTLDPSLNGWLVPYQFEGIEQLEQAASSDNAKAMLADLEAHNLIALGYTFGGMRQILTPKRMTDIAALKGNRFRFRTCASKWSRASWTRLIATWPPPWG